MVISSKHYKNPNFIGVGFRRCGSSWLHRVLSEHPEIGKPKSGLHFFSNDVLYGYGVDWYEQQLSDIKKDVTGEMSVSYSYPENFKKSATRIKKKYPEVKIICCVRNPIERAYSDYRRSLRAGEISKLSFPEAIEINNDFIERGMYGKIIKKYVDLFGDNVKVFFYDDLLSDPVAYVKDVFDFIGVNNDFIPSNIDKPMGHAGLVRSAIYQNYIDRLAAGLSKKLRPAGFGFLIDLVKAGGLQGMLQKGNEVSGESIDVTTRSFLQKVYHRDVATLSSLVGRDLSHWIKN